MIDTHSPLESLAAFAIAFMAGVVSAAALSAYTNYLRKTAAMPKPADSI
jgi:hypothetical protein